MELKIQEVQFPQVIQFNFAELKEEITAKAELYKNMVYTEDTIKEVKADKATLNKFIKVLEDKRKDVKKQCSQPYEDFEKQIKELVAIVNEPVQLIDSQVKAYDEKRKAEKLDQIKAIWEEADHPEWLSCNMIFDNRWLNVTFSLKQVQDAITERLAQINTELTTLNSLTEFAFEAVEVYKNTLDVNRAIAEGQRLADIQKRKKEEAMRKAAAEAAEKEAAIRQAEIEPEVITPAEPVVMIKPDPELTDASATWIRFEACMTKEQAYKLKHFFEEEGIQFRPIA